MTTSTEAQIANAEALLDDEEVTNAQRLAADISLPAGTSADLQDRLDAILAID